MLLHNLSHRLWWNVSNINIIAIHFGWWSLYRNPKWRWINSLWVVIVLSVKLNRNLASRCFGSALIIRYVYLALRLLLLAWNESVTNLCASNQCVLLDRLRRKHPLILIICTSLRSWCLRNIIRSSSGNWTSINYLIHI